MPDFRLLSYSAKDDHPRAGLLIQDQVFDLRESLQTLDTSFSLPVDSVISALKAWDKVSAQINRIVDAIATNSHEGLRFPGRPFEGVKLLAPVLYPGVLYCAGANYRDHLFEMTGKGPPDDYTEPYFFIKTTAGSIIGPNQKIRLPPLSSMVDWEAEIALVIGRTAKNISIDEAMSCVAGYTILNDLSARDLSRRGDVPFGFDWVSQKCFDTSAPMGPWITPTEAIADPYNLTIQLWVNGDLKQNSNSRELIFRFPEQIAYLSRRVTLNPGDVIATGTPAGCGAAIGEFLKPGDIVRIAVSGLGELRNTVAAA